MSCRFIVSLPLSHTSLHASYNTHNKNSIIASFIMNIVVIIIHYMLYMQSIELYNVTIIYYFFAFLFVQAAWHVGQYHFPLGASAICRHSM